MTHALSIGQLAKATGVASRTIRYYEQIGVLPTPSRSRSRLGSTTSLAYSGCASSGGLAP